MGGYLAYADYKDSGVKWIGQIPEFWHVKRFKFVVSEPLKYGANEAAELNNPELPRYIRITDVRENGTLREETFRSLPEEIAEDYLLKTGDILLARSGATVGKTFIYDTSWGKAAYAGYLIRARVSDEISERFIYQFLQSSSYWEWVKSSFIQATIQNISAEKYANLWLPIPCLAEQQQISAFLDYKTAQIDALIAKKEALLEKLAEKRTALISQAVTKGLDPTVEMKDSGIEWLGEIPKHWKLSKAKFAANVFVPQRNKPELNQKIGLPWLTMDDMSKEHISETTFKVTAEAAQKAGSRVLKQGAVIASCVGNFGIAAINDMDVIVNQQLQAFISLKGINPDYLCNIVVLSEDYFKKIATAATIVYVNQTGFGDMPILLPPSNEQTDIVRECQRITSRYGNMAQKVQTGLNRLKEYRTALITNAVTGKIDVRDIKLPESTQIEAA